MAIQSIGGFPPAIFVDENGFTATHTAAKMPAGTIFTATDPATGNWSMLRYYKAEATIAQGAPLVHGALSQTNHYTLKSAATSAIGMPPQGVAAAAMTTGVYGYAYVWGYCPTIKFGTNWASNQYFNVSASFSGEFSSYPGNVATTGSAIGNAWVVYSYGADTGTSGGVGSGTILVLL